MIRGSVGFCCFCRSCCSCASRAAAPGSMPLITVSNERRIACFTERSPGMVPLLAAALERSPPSFDHLVGLRQQRRRHGKTECLGCFQIDHQLEMRGLHDRRIGDIGALEDAAGLDADLMVSIRKARTIA